MICETKNILEVNKLNVCFHSSNGTIPVLNDVSFDLERNSSMGLIGESGAGKTLTCLAILKLLPSSLMDNLSGTILYNKINLLGLKEEELRKIRGDRIAIVFQNPLTSLNPSLKIGKQLNEVLIMHRNMSTQKAIHKSVEMLNLVGVDDAEERMNQYPHQLSGGLCQRVMIAMALLCEPDILIADEPTSAIDPMLGVQALSLIRKYQKQLSMSLIIVSHNIGLIKNFTDFVAVMYDGNILERGTPLDVTINPCHPYTNHLIESSADFAPNRVYQFDTTDGIALSKPDKSAGCVYYSQCSKSKSICLTTKPFLSECRHNHWVACFFPE